MKNLTILTIFLTVGFLSIIDFNLVFAQESNDSSAIISEAATTTEETTATETSAETTEIATTTAVDDLEVENPGILPTNPFYFIKKWTWGIKRTFTFNPIKKAELELKIANEQAAEIKKMEEVAPDRVDAISKAAQNYQDNIDKLKSRLEGLKETSQNPNVDKLLEKLTDKSLRHQKLFDRLEKKFEGKDNLSQQFMKAKEKFGEIMSEIPKKLETEEDFEKRVEKAKERIEKEVEEGKITKENVEKMISEIKNLILKAENASATSTEKVSEKIKEIIKKANERLNEAEASLGEEKIGKAFGQATAARAEMNKIIMMLRSSGMILKPSGTSTPFMKPTPIKPMIKPLESILKNRKIVPSASTETTSTPAATSTE